MKDKIICNGNSNHEKAYVCGNATNEIIPNGLISKAEVKIENKEKQVEKMAKVMQKCYEKNGLLNFKWFAESAYKCLTEDNVVISNKQCVEMIQYNYNMGYEKGSKETAEKLIAKIKQFLSNVETVWEEDKYSLYPDVGYKCSEVDDFLDKLEKEEVNL